MTSMRQNFKPEFINRIDEFVIFNSLGKDALRSIVAMEVERLSKRVAVSSSSDPRRKRAEQRYGSRELRDSLWKPRDAPAVRRAQTLPLS